MLSCCLILYLCLCSYFIFKHALNDSAYMGSVTLLYCSVLLINDDDDDDDEKTRRKIGDRMFSVAAPRA